MLAGRVMLEQRRIATARQHLGWTRPICLLRAVSMPHPGCAAARPFGLARRGIIPARAAPARAMSTERSVRQAILAGTLGLALMCTAAPASVGEAERAPAAQPATTATQSTDDAQPMTDPKTAKKYQRMTKLKELEEARQQLYKKEMDLLQREAELDREEQSADVLRRELEVERALRRLYEKSNSQADEIIALAGALCGGAMIPPQLPFQQAMTSDRADMIGLMLGNVLGVYSSHSGLQFWVR
eukprot:TRINITY_DN30907_c0_g1_i1.p1 TRINITY_DN30907_c0_g1~~TRINITY_DN30907_c0_g1_i1.p1  ORF type:complete len:264 (-),score=23.79 TRINITY_DN30907_c0_g1_i1:164-892(-)